MSRRREESLDEDLLDEDDPLLADATVIEDTDADTSDADSSPPPLRERRPSLLEHALRHRAAIDPFADDDLLDVEEEAEDGFAESAVDDEEVEEEEAPRRWWRCRCCLLEFELPVGARPPSVCRGQGCGQIGSIFALPVDYAPAPRVDALRRRRPAIAWPSAPAQERPPMPRFPIEEPTGRALIVDPRTVVREPLIRTPTGIEGFDRVTSGGLAEGYVIMVAGPPGAGKSTLVTQVGSSVHNLGTHFGDGVAYGSAEEDDSAVIETADRVAEANFKIVLATSCQSLIDGLDETDAVVWIVDSLMAITSDDVDSEPGTPSQINACATLLYQRSHAMPGTRFEGMERRSILIVAHGTKDGNMAGPLKALHSVDGGILMEHVDPTGLETKGNVPWAPVKDQTKPTGFVSARVYRKMRKASNKECAYFVVQPRDLPSGERNPVGGRLDHVEGPQAR